jgi:hypothetical protein
VGECIASIFRDEEKAETASTYFAWFTRLTLKIEVLHSSKSVNLYQPIGHYTPEDGILQAVS